MHPFRHLDVSDLPFGRAIRCSNNGVVIGRDTALVRATSSGRFAVQDDSTRCIALLSILCREPQLPSVLRPIEAAAGYWAIGDKALANLRLVFSDLPTLEEPADADRLHAAAYCLDQGLAPDELMKALGLDPSVLNLRKFDPNQPRVPAGSGRESGRWTDGSSYGRSDEPLFRPSKPHRIRIAANGPFRPEGIETVPSPPVDPLDPQNLNKAPPTPEEQQAIADTLTIIRDGTAEEVKKKLQPHPYQNLPHRVTGAVLPVSPQGYTSYNVRSADSTARGTRRLVINQNQNEAYYTSNHYFSFYGVDVDKR